MISQFLIFSLFFFSLIYKGGTSKKLSLNGRKVWKRRKSTLRWIFQNRKSRGRRTRENRVRSSCRWKKESKCVLKNVQINYTVIRVLANLNFVLMRCVLSFVDSGEIREDSERSYGNDDFTSVSRYSFRYCVLQGDIQHHARSSRKRRC